MILRSFIKIILILGLTGCNTVTGSIEGTAMGVAKDIKTTYHYSTCVFTKVQCGDLDLD
jgi:predicted small secreted protein